MADHANSPGNCCLMLHASLPWHHKFASFDHLELHRDDPIDRHPISDLQIKLKLLRILFSKENEVISQIWLISLRNLFLASCEKSQEDEI